MPSRLLTSLLLSFKLRENIVDGIDYGQTCEELMDKCLPPNSEADVGIDNMTVIIVVSVWQRAHRFGFGFVV